MLDEIFRIEADKYLKAQNLIKKERNSRIEGYLMAYKTPESRDYILEQLRKISIKDKAEIPSEHKEQADFVAWFRSEYPCIRIFAIPNGGNRSITEANRLKAEGVEPGVFDIYIPEWHLWIEFKRTKGGKISKDQDVFYNYVIEKCRDSAFFAFGCDDAKNKLFTFLKKVIKI